jgi:hypothetical protein
MQMTHRQTGRLSGAVVKVNQSRIVFRVYHQQEVWPFCCYQPAEQ